MYGRYLLKKQDEKVNRNNFGFSFVFPNGTMIFAMAGLPIKALSEKAQAVVVCFSPPTDGYIRQKVTNKIYSLDYAVAGDAKLQS